MNPKRSARTPLAPRCARRYRLAAVLLVAISTSVPLVSLAAPKDAASMEEARRHFKQGVLLFEDKNFDAALVEFEASYAASSEPVSLYNVGLCLRALFRYQEAIDALTRYLQGVDEKFSPQQRRAVEQVIAEMRDLLAEITIVVDPSAAAISSAFLDGRAVVLTRAPMALAAGRHQLNLTARGFDPAIQEIVVVAGRPQTVRITLQPSVSAIAPPGNARPEQLPQSLRAPGPETSSPAAPPALRVGSPGATPSRPATPFYESAWFWAAATVVVLGGAIAGTWLAKSGESAEVRGSLGSKRLP